MLHRGGRSDCIWAAFHRTAKMLAFSTKKAASLDLTLTFRDLHRRHPLVDFR